MPKITESRFKAKRVTSDPEDIYDIDLVDLESNFPVIVEGEHENYTPDLKEQIDNLEKGDEIKATIKSEDLEVNDALWHFKQIEIIDALITFSAMT